MAPSRQGPRWHDERRKRLLAQHPEVRALVGPNPWSAAVVVVLVLLQGALAVALADQPWWVILVAAWCVGAFVAHALGVLIHEAAHDLVFRAPWANKALSILANVPLVFPAAIDFRGQHLKHHAHLGEPDGADTQAPRAWDFRFARDRLHTFVWHLLGPLMIPIDPRTRFAPWRVANLVANYGGALLFTAAFGFGALLFLGASGVMAFGHHPVGVRRYGEHYPLAEGQPTTSYYGPLNWLSFDVGYHVEHHDLPSVPWNHLRALHKLAPELYAGLSALHSWTWLLWRLMWVPGEGPPRYFLERRPVEVEAGAHPHGDHQSP